MTQYGEMMYTSFDTNPHSHCALVYLSGGLTRAGQFSSHTCPWWRALAQMHGGHGSRRCYDTAMV